MSHVPGRESTSTLVAGQDPSLEAAYHLQRSIPVPVYVRDWLEMVGISRQSTSPTPPMLAGWN